MNQTIDMDNFSDETSMSDALAESAQPFRTPAGVPFVKVMHDGICEVWPNKSAALTHLLQILRRRETGKALSKKDLAAFLEVLQSEAQFGEAVEEVHLRVARVANRIYIDLCDTAWRVIEIDAEGWRILCHSPVNFRRATGMLPLPDPVPGGNLNTLWQFMHVEDPGQRLLVIAHVLATMAGIRPVPLLYLLGGEGTAKSTATEILRQLADPHVAGLRSMPKSERDLFVSAQHSHMLAYDNISQIGGAMSDALCRVATGGTFAARQLFSDSDEIFLKACNPVVCNGIVQAIVRPDLIDRTITVKLGSIPDTERLPHEEVLREFEAARPALLGALCNALSIGLRRAHGIARRPLPRMADFAKWAIACEPAYATDGAFLAAYQQNIQHSNVDAIDDDPLASRIRDLLARRSGWASTATRLDETLRGMNGGPIPQDWPRTAKLLSDHLRRIAPGLNRVGIAITFERTGHDRERIIKLSKAAS